MIEVQPSEVERESLSRYLELQPEFVHTLPIRSVQRIGGGQSNLTFRLLLSDRTVVLRRPPLGPLPPRAHDVLREARVMDALQGSGVPVPRVLLSCSDQSVLGAPFVVMDDLPADAIRSELPGEYELELEAPRLVGKAVMETLAALHAIDPDKVGLGDLSKPTGYLERQIRLWQSQLEYARVRPAPDLDWTSGWLVGNMPKETEEGRLVHGDYKLDNVLFSRGLPVRLEAVVDWEMAALGDPQADLGWLLAFWCEDGAPPPELSILPRLTERPGFPRRAELAQWYGDRTGRGLASLVFYQVLALWKMAILLEGHWARHVRGTAGCFDFTYLERGGPVFAAYIRRVALGQA